MIASRSKQVNQPITEKARTKPFSQLKLPTNGKVLQRFIYHLKVPKLSKNKATNVTCDEVVNLGKKVSNGCISNYTCYKTINSIKTTSQNLWNRYMNIKTSLLDEWNIQESCMAMRFDTTASNTG